MKTMTVKQLIEKLESCDPDEVIVIGQQRHDYGGNIDGEFPTIDSAFLTSDGTLVGQSRAEELGEAQLVTVLGACPSYWG